MEVYALIGASGTGKSYKALQIARQLEIDHIIDDGILISRSKKIGGASAKREASRLTAVKRAIFHFEDHREEMKRHLEEEQPKRLLIIGTSDRMVEQIAENLGVAPIKKRYRIEEVSTQEEIDTAKDIRMREGKHVIPLPAMEVKQDFSGYFMDRLRVLIRKRGHRSELAEKTIVRPTFSYIGRYTISIKAVYQIMAFSLNENPAVVQFLKGRMTEDEDGIRLSCDVIVNNSVRLTRLGPVLQKTVKEAVEEMTGLNVKNIDVTIKNIHIF